VESKLSWSYDGQSFLPNITYNTSAFSPLFYIAVVFWYRDVYTRSVYSNRASAKHIWCGPREISWWGPVVYLLILIMWLKFQAHMGAFSYISEEQHDW